jgi:glucose/arabinose dehydrogenase
MKRGSSFVIFFAVVLLLTAVLAQPRSRAAADPSPGLIRLPIISSPDSPPQIRLERYVTGFNPDGITGIVHAGDERLFVLERKGRIRIVQPGGTLQNKPFLDLSDTASSTSWEEGLLGMAFHPRYPQTPYFFVVYTIKENKIVLARFSVDPKDPNRAVRDSELLMMSISKKPPGSQGDFKVHNGGDLHFGPDGYLYIGIGDGGPDPWPGHEGDPYNKGQRRDELMANILRIDVDSKPGSAAPDCGREGYTVPADNPFVDGWRGDCDEIWSTGLRNPYRFSFDRATGDMYIGDVGEKLHEEVNFQPAGSKGGANYGWHCYEGTTNYAWLHPGIILDTCPAGTSFTMPIHEYDQSEKDCSVVGGYVYRGQAFPELIGRYLFGDYCTGRAWLLTRTSATSWSRSTVNPTNVPISTWGEDVHGELYAGEYRRDQKPVAIYRVIAEP